MWGIGPLVPSKLVTSCFYLLMGVNWDHMAELSEEFKEYTRHEGDEALPGAGRPRGSKNKVAPLPKIHVDGLPYPVVAVKRGETPESYWNRQAPKTLMYMFKRLDAYIVYQEQGIADPFGAAVFKLLGKELVKEVRVRAVKTRADALNTDPNEGATVKKFRKSLVKMRESLAPDAEIIDVEPIEVGEFNPIDLDVPRVDDIEDEF